MKRKSEGGGADDPSVGLQVLSGLPRISSRLLRISSRWPPSAHTSFGLVSAHASFGLISAHASLGLASARGLASVRVSLGSFYNTHLSLFFSGPSENALDHSPEALDFTEALTPTKAQPRTSSHSGSRLAANRLLLRHQLRLGKPLRPPLASASALVPSNRPLLQTPRLRLFLRPHRL